MNEVRLPGTGARMIPGRSTLFEKSLLVSGESPALVERLVDEKTSSTHRKSENVRGFREFIFLTYEGSNGASSFNLLITGLGSASVELALQEGYLCGSREFTLLGTCASLNREIRVGDFIVPETCFLRPGAFAEYDPALVNFQIPEEEIREWKARVATKLTEGNRLHACKVMSTDSFYGMGASMDAQGKAVYGGAPLRRGRPASLDYLMKNPDRIDVLDMELASFMAFGREMVGVRTQAVKIVSNPIPWDESFSPIANDVLLERVVALGLSIV